MTKKAIDKKENIEEKLEYLGLDLEKIPESIRKFEPLEFRVPKFYDENQYRQYRYVSIKDIQILLSPTNRMDEIDQKYKKASPLSDYLDSKNEENILKYTTFLNMVKQVNIDDIKKIEKEQNELNKKIPFKVKFEGNYLWQIYYSSNTDKYFMIVPTEDSDYSTFFFLLKKKLEKKRTGKIFVPIRNMGYSNKFLRKTEFEDIENYLWLFTKDWPLVYEIYDKKDNACINIIGETEVYNKIKSPYKIVLNSREEANKFYKLLKAMFILQTELPQYFEFKTNIDNLGGIEFAIDDRIIEYESIVSWINDEYEMGQERIKQADILIKENEEKLEKLKIEVASQDLEYLAKEKQISTFLECKKSFFGKFKYYFKYSKKNKNKIKSEEINTEVIVEEKKEDVKVQKRKNIRKKENFTIEQLVELYKEFEQKENELKNIMLDINALKLKKKNMAKKIENATMFIEEIDSHKKSIFEFWKYSNKDEVAVLPEGEAEEINITKKISKVFDYEQDFEKFGKTMDKIQRKVLSKEETDSIYITTTDILEILNKVKNSEALPKDIESSLKQVKKEAITEKTLSEKDDFDIFGGIAQDITKVSEINNKKHRELPKDKFNILEISKNTKQIGYKLSLEKVNEDIKEALTKIVIPEDICVYKAISDEELKEKNINIFNINPEKEIKEVINHDPDKINFYKINLIRGTNVVSYTNIIFYDNQNKTLPIGQDLSTKILIDVSKLNIQLKESMDFKIVKFEDQNDDFTEVDIKTVNVFEYDINEQK